MTAIRYQSGVYKMVRNDGEGNLPDYNTARDLALDTLARLLGK